jgi:hypothetical protein
MYGLERIGKGQRADELFKKGEVMFGVINGSPKCQGAAAKEWLAERKSNPGGKERRRGACCG